MALDSYSGIPELSGEANAIARRRKIAEMMMAQSQEQLPVNQMAGQVVAPVSWTQGLAKLANAYLGKKQADEADKAEQGLANKREQLVAEELNKVRKIAEGTAGVEGIQAQPERTIQAPAPMQPNQVAPNYGTVPETVPAVAGRDAVPAVAGDTRKAIMEAVMSNLPEVQKYAGALSSFEEMDAKYAEKDAARLAAQEQKKLDREAKIEQIQMQIQSREMMGQQTNDLRAAMANLQAETRRDIAEQASADRRMIASMASADRRASAGNKAPIQITDEAGNVKLVDYEGNLVRDLGKVGKPTAGYQKDGITKKKLSSDLDLTISELENASKDGGLIDQSTGSGAGALVDMANDFVGRSTKGSIAVGKMKPIYDMALKMVPRFEGPQSDKDTQSYREAAGELANANVPNKRKKAAAKEMVRLMKQRKGQFIDKANEGTELDTSVGGGNGEWKVIK